jgi:integrative and conjugative element protein (TIGR02256 family)
VRASVIRVFPAAASVIEAEAPSSSDGRETGGILLGHDNGTVVSITAAGGPGPKAVRTPVRFVRDLAYSQSLADEAYERDRSVWVGEWHTHPNGLPNPSPLDVKTYMSHLAEPDLGFHRFVAFIVVPCRVHGWVETVIVPWVLTTGGATVASLELETESQHE